MFGGCARLRGASPAAANLLQCELFPGDFKKVLEMLVHVAVVWSRSKRLEGMPLENAGEVQLARLLDLFFRCAQLRQPDMGPLTRSASCMGSAVPGPRLLHGGGGWGG
jgi:hypothetical protein